MTGAALEPTADGAVDPDSDEGLMSRYAQGDAGAFDVLYQRHRSRLFRFLQHQTGSRAIAEELYQDVWMNLIRARERYVVTARFSTFLLTIAHHRVADHFRERAPQKTSELIEDEIDQRDRSERPVSDPAQLVQQRQEIRRVDQALMQLSAEQREIFLLRHEGDATLEELAEMTGVSRETAKSRLRYALGHLKRLLGEDA
jgi:RNA polymerase sigma-70 factor (ECF subfamily)